MGARDLLLREVVEAQREPLREPAVVDEDDRRAVLLDELEERRVDGRPDGLSLARLAHVVQGDDDPEVELLRAPGVHELERPATRDEASDLVHRPLRRRETDALERLSGQPLQPFQTEGEMCAALRSGHGMHLVDDDDAHRAERFSSARGEHEEERFRRRDEDVRRAPEHGGTFLCRSVAGSDGDREL